MTETFLFALADNYQERALELHRNLLNMFFLSLQNDIGIRVGFFEFKSADGDHKAPQKGHETNLFSTTMESHFSYIIIKLDY